MVVGGFILGLLEVGLAAYILDKVICYGLDHL